MQKDKLTDNRFLKDGFYQPINWWGKKMQKDKLTDDKEVIRLLEIFASDNEPDGVDRLAGMALDLIRRLQYGYSSASKASEAWKAKYEKERKENAELQKQVDELKNYAERLFEENQDHYDKLQNANLYIEKHEPIWKRNTEQAEKDTAKEILTEIDDLTLCIIDGSNEFEKGYFQAIMDMKTAIKDLIKEHYGVEVK